MIKVTKINGSEIVVNADLIETVEHQTDTAITMFGKNIIRVKETLDEIIDRVVEYRRKINQKDLKGGE
jgi:flagellar protein FlbD